MDENILKFRVGIFVVIAMLILAILVVVNSEGLNPQYTIFVKPNSAPGVTKGTPIRKNGILIGRVKRVTTVTPDDDSVDDYVLLELAINSGEKIYANEIASIGSESLLGDAVVEFVRGEELDEQGKRLPRGLPVGEKHTMDEYAVKRNPLEFVDMFADLKPELSETLAAVQRSSVSVEKAGDGISDLSTTIESAFAEDSKLSALVDDISKMSQSASASLKRADESLKTFEQAAEHILAVVGDEEFKARVNEGLVEFRGVFSDVRDLVDDTRKTINLFGDIPDGVNANLENMEAFTSALKDRGPEILKQTDESLKNVDKFIAEVRVFTKSFSNLDESNGTISKLLNDSEMYDTALETVKKLRDVSTKIEPMINDLRMFADSIARDPGVVGVRGALDRRPSKTGAKENTAGRDGGLFRSNR